MRHPLMLDTACAHPFGNRRELARRLFRDSRAGLLGTQFLGIGEDPAQNLTLILIVQIIETNLARLVRIAGEGGMNDDPLAVAHHQQRRVVEMTGIVGQLLVGFVQIQPWLLVFPAEVSALPDIRPALTAGGLLRPALEAVVIGIARLVDPQQIAQILEIGLRPLTLGQRVALPFRNERIRCHKSSPPSPQTRTGRGKPRSARRGDSGATPAAVAV